MGGKISDKNTKYPLTIPKDLKASLEEIAIKQTRTLNNLMIVALKEYEQKYK